MAPACRPRGGSPICGPRTTRRPTCTLVVDGARGRGRRRCAAGAAALGLAGRAAADGRRAVPDRPARRSAAGRDHPVHRAAAAGPAPLPRQGLRLRADGGAARCAACICPRSRPTAARSPSPRSTHCGWRPLRAAARPRRIVRADATRYVLGAQLDPRRAGAALRGRPGRAVRGAPPGPRLRRGDGAGHRRPGAARAVAGRRAAGRPGHVRQPRRTDAGRRQRRRCWPRRWAPAGCPAGPAGHRTAATWRTATAIASTAASARATTSSGSSTPRPARTGCTRSPSMSRSPTATTPGPCGRRTGAGWRVIAESALWVLPVRPDGTPDGAPRRLTDESADHPSWSGDSGTLLYLSAGQAAADRSVRRRGTDRPARPRTAPLARPGHRRPCGPVLGRHRRRGAGGRRCGGAGRADHRRGTAPRGPRGRGPAGGRLRADRTARTVGRTHPPVADDIRRPADRAPARVRHHHRGLLRRLLLRTGPYPGGRGGRCARRAAAADLRRAAGRRTGRVQHGAGAPHPRGAAPLAGARRGPGLGLRQDLCTGTGLGDGGGRPLRPPAARGPRPGAICSPRESSSART